MQEGTASPEPYTDSAETGSESEKITDDDDDDDSFEDDDVSDSSEVDIDVNSVHALSETSSETGETEDNKKVISSLAWAFVKQQNIVL